MSCSANSKGIFFREGGVVKGSITGGGCILPTGRFTSCTCEHVKAADVDADLVNCNTIRVLTKKIDCFAVGPWADSKRVSIELHKYGHNTAFLKITGMAVGDVERANEGIEFAFGDGKDSLILPAEFHPLGEYAQPVIAFDEGEHCFGVLWVREGGSLRLTNAFGSFTIGAKGGFQGQLCATYTTV
jgi:hypothetical protein